MLIVRLPLVTGGVRFDAAFEREDMSEVEL